MDQNIPQSPFPQSPVITPPSNSAPQKGKGSLFIILLMLLVLCAGGIASIAGYFILTGKKLPVEFDFNNFEMAVAESESTPSPAQNSLEGESTLRGIVQTALTVKNYSLLIDSLNPVSTFIIESTGCCGQLSIAEVIEQLSYLNESTTWTFDQSNETIQIIKENNPDTYQNMTIGISDNKYVFGYTTNEQGKITDIRIAGTYDLLIPASVESPPPGTPLPTRRPSATPTITPLPSPSITPEEIE